MSKKTKKAPPQQHRQFGPRYIVYRMRSYNGIGGPVSETDGDFNQYLRRGADIIACGTREAMTAAARLLGASNA